ncbi:MAG: ABC transporter substrate-binding protein [Acidimicrobiales bacterium]
MTTMSRRRFLALAGMAAAGAACGPSSGGRSSTGRASSTTPATGDGPKTLRIALRKHFVPAYDDWFDNEFTRRWGDEHGVAVVVDHIQEDELVARASAEIAAQSGHDLFGFISPPPAFEDEVIDHRDIVEEVRAKVGPLLPLVERSILNPKTGKFFAFSDSWTPGVVHYRSDLWQPLGRLPDTWDSILVAAPSLKAGGHPLGMGMSPNNIDGSGTLMSLLHAYGASVQDEESRLTINTPAAVEAVRVGAAIQRAGMTDDIFSWEASSNNRYLAAGTGSLIVNAISALRAIENQNPQLAGAVNLAPTPAGPAGRHGVYFVATFVIWKFSPNQDLAARFLVDHAIGYREAFERSRFYNMPSFAGSTPDLAALLGADPSGKYGVLAGATDWTVNLGWPGRANAAVDQVLNEFIVPDMFRAAARGERTPAEAVADAEARMRPIFDRWREQGKV